MLIDSSFQIFVFLASDPQSRPFQLRLLHNGVTSPPPTLSWAIPAMLAMPAMPAIPAIPAEVIPKLLLKADIAPGRMDGSNPPAPQPDW